jgi:hypothetical protein
MLVSVQDRARTRERPAQRVQAQAADRVEAAVPLPDLAQNPPPMGVSRRPDTALATRPVAHRELVPGLEPCATGARALAQTWSWLEQRDRNMQSTSPKQEVLQSYGEARFRESLDVVVSI